MVSTAIIVIVSGKPVTVRLSLSARIEFKFVTLEISTFVFAVEEAGPTEVLATDSKVESDTKLVRASKATRFFEIQILTDF